MSAGHVVLQMPDAIKLLCSTTVTGKHLLSAGHLTITVAPKTQINDGSCGVLSIDGYVQFNYIYTAHHCVGISGPKNPVI